MIAKDAKSLVCDRKPYAIETDDDVRVLARTVIIATGAAYRKPPIENLLQFENAGVYYGATFMEAQLCRGEEAVVVGGGNSAGQAAVFLAQTAKRVHMLVRSSGLAESMSRYLIRRIEQNPAIVLRTNTEIVALEGNNHLERVRWHRSARQHRDPRHKARFPYDRRSSRDEMGRGMHCARCQRIHQDGSGSVPGGFGRRPLAACQAAPSSRNESAGSVRGR